jgi:hypothetical protein
MRRDWIARLPRVIALTLLLLATALLNAVPAQAAAARTPSSGDTLTLALTNGTSFVYAGQSGPPAAPKFTAILVLAVQPTANYYRTVNVAVGGQTITGAGPTPSPDGVTFTFTIDTMGTPIPVGAQTAVASFYNAATGLTTQSNSVGPHHHARDAAAPLLDPQLQPHR